MHLGPQVFLVHFMHVAAVLRAFNGIALPTFTSHGGRKMPHLPQQLKFNALPAPFNASWTGVFDINLPSSLSKVLADHCCRDFAKRTHAHHKSCPNFPPIFSLIHLLPLIHLQATTFDNYSSHNIHHCMCQRAHPSNCYLNQVTLVHVSTLNNEALSA